MNRNTRRFFLLLLVLALSLSITAVAAANGHAPRNFRAHLNGDGEVPPVDSGGQGQAIFQLSNDGSELSYSLIVANIENVTQAHIHCGPPDDNGPVVVFLFGRVPDPGVSHNGVLSEGTATDAHVITRGDSEICPGGVSSLADVVRQIDAGNAYVNVHTVDNPGGEIRGQMH